MLDHRSVPKATNLSAADWNDTDWNDTGFAASHVQAVVMYGFAKKK